MTDILIKLAPNADGENVYYPGQTLHGTVELFLSSPKDLNGFYILITGGARCFVRRYSLTKATVFIGGETYLESKNYLIGNESRELRRMQPGNHILTFAFELPRNLPESVEVRDGLIEYKAEAVLDVPWKFEKKICVPFKIKRNDSPNDFPKLMLPMHLEKQKTFFCIKGKCTMRASIPQNVFAVGETIPVKIECVNLSNLNIKDITIKLIEKTTLIIPKTKIKNNTIPPRKLNKVRIEGVKSGDILERNQEVLIKIKSNSNHSNKLFSNIIKIKHILEIRFKTGWCHVDLLVQFPITII